MIGQVATNKVSRVLDPPYIKEDGSKEKNPMWTKIVLMLLIPNVLLILMVVMKILAKEQSAPSMYIAILFLIAMDVYVAYTYIKVRIFLPKEFNAAIEKFGRAELMSQIADPETKAFFLAPELYDSLTIVTRDYLINANELILPLKDVRAITFSRRHFTEEQLRRIDREPYQRLIMSNVYYANIVSSDGKNNRKLVSVLDEDMPEFLKTLKEVAPHAGFTCI